MRRIQRSEERRLSWQSNNHTAIRRESQTNECAQEKKGVEEEVKDNRRDGQTKTQRMSNPLLAISSGAIFFLPDTFNLFF